jgi:hypothetical protein
LRLSQDFDRLDRILEHLAAIERRAGNPPLLKSGPGKLLTAAIDAKTTLQKLEKECVRIGANLDLERWDITAPQGRVFNATECHYIVFERWKEDRSPRWGKASEGWNKIERSAAYQDALARLKLGLILDPEPS